MVQIKVFRGIFAILIAVQSALLVLGQSSDRQVITGRDVAAVNEVADGLGGLEASPDGKRVLYRVTRPLMDQNKYVYEWWVADTSGSSASRKISDSTSLRRPRWSSDSKSILYIPEKADEIRLILLDDLSERIVAKRSNMAANFEGLQFGNISSPKMSPDRRSIAFIISSKEKTPDEGKVDPNQGNQIEKWRSMEMDVEPQPPTPSQRAAGLLCVFDSESKRFRLLTDRSLNVLDFDWSPDSTRLVISAMAAGDIRDRRPSDFAQKNLYIVEKNGGRASMLVTKEDTACLEPIWSPDGKWIAFGIVPDLKDPRAGRHDRIAIVASSGGEPKHLTSDDNVIGAPEWGNGWRFWSSDSKSVYFTPLYRLSTPLFRVPVTGGDYVKVSPDDSSYSKFSASADGKTVAFVSSSTPGQPGDVYVSSLSFTDKKKLTDLNPQLKDRSWPLTETVKWRSADNRWDIHGLLAKPIGYKKGERYPLIVAVKGGQGMVDRSFNSLNGTVVPTLQFASRGYAVLWVNTRGRRGYGRDFYRARDSEKSLALNAVGDITSGVGEIVKRGIANPDRVAVAGHSYGAMTTSVVITQTNLFKAAWLGDPPIVNHLLLPMRKAGQDEPFDYFGLGIKFPLSPEDLKLLFDESPLYHLHNVKTPTLMHCGETSYTARWSTCVDFLQGLRSFNVPSELMIWPQQGHGPSKPLTLEETFNQQVEWMDYWVRGITTERMAKRYGPPKNPPESTAAAATNGRGH